MKKALSVLHLNLKREFFDRIALGTKRVEYREYKPFWRNRLEGRHYDVIHFRNGYATKAPKMVVDFKSLGRDGDARRAQYAIKLGKILKITGWKKPKA